MLQQPKTLEMTKKYFSLVGLNLNDYLLQSGKFYPMLTNTLNNEQLESLLEELYKVFQDTYADRIKTIQNLTTDYSTKQFNQIKETTLNTYSKYSYSKLRDTLITYSMELSNESIDKLRDVLSKHNADLEDFENLLKDDNEDLLDLKRHILFNIQCELGYFDKDINIWEVYVEPYIKALEEKYNNNCKVSIIDTKVKSITEYTNLLDIISIVLDESIYPKLKLYTMYINQCDNSTDVVVDLSN